MNVLKNANDVRETHGYAGLWEEVANKTHEYISAVPTLDTVCFNRSVRQLRRRMEQEESLDDVLDTTGTYYDPRGAYRGWGKYRTLWAKQERAEIAAVAEAAAEIDPETVLEIGSLYGGTLYVWTRYLAPDNMIISVDKDHRGREQFFETFVSVTGAEMKLIEGSSYAEQTLQNVRQVLDEPIDFLYIDGDHSYDGVKRDFEAYSQFLADDGIVALHDVENEETGVPTFWAELEAEYDTRTVGTRTGRTGIVYR